MQEPNEPQLNRLSYTIAAFAALGVGLLLTGIVIGVSELVVVIF
jgi:hypothetical protein